MTLGGQRILVLRPRDQAQGVAAELARLGAEPILLPALEIRPPEDPAPLAETLARLGAYDWIVFTSANAVAAVFSRASLPASLRVAAVGPKTAEALAARGVTPDLVPEVATAEALAEAMRGLEGVRRVLFPRADRAREGLAWGLRAAGIQVDDPIAYRSTPVRPEGEGLERLKAGEVDWVLVTSPSTLEALAASVSPEVWERTRLASIGPVTSEAIRRHGLRVAVEAVPHTMEGLLRAIADFSPG